MRTDPKIFKAYDIRGIYPFEINEKIAYAVGRALAIYLKPNQIVIGRDARLSSPSLTKNAIKGIIDQGVDVIDIGLATTPMMYFAAAKYHLDGGIMVTASHNIRELNGFKVIGRNILPLSGDKGIKEIQEIISQKKFFSILSFFTKKGRVTHKEVLSDYVDNIFKFTDVNRITNLKIVTDAGNGMAGLVFTEIVKQLLLKCQIIPLFWDLDGSFPNHLPNPTKLENLTALINKIKEEKADLGIATDGDADRIVFIDERGENIRTDCLFALLAKDVLEKHPGASIVYDLRMGWIVKEVIQENNGRGFVSRVGHSFIKQKMREVNAIFAGEFASHYYLGGELNNNNFFEAPFQIALMVLELLNRTNKKISELIAPFKKYYNTGELSFEVGDKEKVFKNVKSFYNQNKIISLDGIKVEFEDWWFILRPSNTEPVIRLIVEAISEDLMEEKKAELIELIRGKFLA